MVLTGISFAETIVVSLGTIFIVELLGERLGTPIAIVIIAILLLIFAKVIPKTIAAQHPEQIALHYGKTIELLMRLLSPVVVMLSWVISAITRITHSSTMPGALISREEIGTIISIGEEEGVVDEHSADILRKVVSLGDRPVQEVMTPRTEAIWFQQGATLADFFKVYAESPAQRYPVYEETFDNVKGMLSIRDVLTAVAKRSIDRKGSVTDLARPVYYVPENKKVSELLGEMQEEGYLMAVVVDEYGGSSGIVSIDQLIEEIVGEVEEKIMGVTKTFKVVGEQIVYDNLSLVVAQVKNNKITRLFITKESPAEETEDTISKEPSEKVKEETDDAPAKESNKTRYLLL